MMRLFLTVAGCILIGASPAPPPHWSENQLEQLAKWVDIGRDEGLQVKSRDFTQNALVGGQQERDEAATATANELLTSYRQGCCNRSLRSGWHIGRTWPDAAETVAEAIALDRIDAVFAAARPSHPFYRALGETYSHETDASKRATLAANLDRWRWMPRDLGKRYLLVNAAAFEATLWEGENRVGRWAVIIGRTKSPTPVFEARITGVTINHWWNIPPRIAAEGIAAMLVRNPAEARRRGYVVENGRYRQRPGPANALGRMKLVMPNPFNVYLHDTPAQALFAHDVRAYSHGCVRVGDALGLAATLAGPAWNRAKIDALVDVGQTRTIAIVEPIPVYVVYFTAEPNDVGGIRYFPDIYHRDAAASAPQLDGQCTR